MIKYIQINGHRTAYHESSKTGTPIVFVHGNSHSHLTFSKQLNSTLSSKYRLLAIDLLGHGQSDCPSSSKSYSIKDQGKALANWAKEVNAEAAVFAGHSLGGHIALEAMKYLPLAKGLFVWGTPPISDLSSMAAAFNQNEALAGFFKGDVSEDEAKLMARCCYRENSDYWKDSFEMILQTNPNTRNYLAAEIMAGNFSDEIEILNTIKCPFTLIRSENDTLINNNYFDTIDIPRSGPSKIIDIKNSSHSPHVETPSAFNQILENFCLDLISSEEQLNL